MMHAVEAEKLSKTFAQGKKAVDGIDLAIKQGEIYGFLGPNGAGKTTTVKLLNGLLQPSGGLCRVMGADPVSDPASVHRLSGVVTEHAQMYGLLTGLENLMYYGALFDLKKTDCRARATALLDELGLSDAMNQRLCTYSTGMRQRLSLARAMIHKPKLLFLDEPTTGLDPESAQNVNSRIKALARDEGTTVFLCTHQLRYAQEICDTYGLIDNGVMLATGGLEGLRYQVGSMMQLTINANGQTMHHNVSGEREIADLVRRHVQKGDDVYHVYAKRPSLEDIYFTLIDRRKAADKEQGH